MQVDEVVVKSEPRDYDEDVEIKVRDRSARPLANSTKVNGGTNATRRKVVNATSVKSMKIDPLLAEAKAEPELKPVRAILSNGRPAAPPGSTHWSAVQDSLLPQASTSEIDHVSAPTGSTKAENILDDDDGSLKMFWLDFMELEGAVHLVGKVLDRKTGKYVSACVSVNGIQRNLFVKPRAKRYCERHHLVQRDHALLMPPQLATMRRI